MPEIFHVLYQDVADKKWKIHECQGEDEVKKWQVGNPGAMKIRFMLQPLKGTGNVSYPTLQDAIDAGEPGDSISPKVDNPNMGHEAAEALCSLGTVVPAKIKAGHSQR